MVFFKGEKFFLFIGYLLLFALGWVIQDQLFLNWDVSMLLNAADKLLSGGTYADDFFTPNPPMILYLYLPPLLLSKTTGFDIIFIFRAYLFLLTGFSFCLIYYLSKNIFPSKKLSFLFLLSVIIVLVLIPLYEFGQREHLLIIFSLPYLFLVVNRLDGYKINLYLAVMIGIINGLGLAIKPQFLLLPLFIESFVMLRQKNLLAWVRPETIASLVFLSLYTLVILFFHPDYIAIILPFMWQHYYGAISAPLIHLLTTNIVVFGAFCVLFFFLEKKTLPYQSLPVVLLVAIFAYFFIYLVQGTLFYYHTIPFFSLCILLLVILLAHFIEQYRHRFSVALASFLILYLFSIFFGLYIFATNYKNRILHPLIAFMHTQPPHQSIYILSLKNYSSPLIHYTDTSISERFDSIWFVESLVKKRMQCGDTCLKAYLIHNEDKPFFLDLIADDIRKHRPDLVFVDVSKKNTGMNGQTHYFAYLDYFLLNKNFRDAWQPYRYLTTIGSSACKLEIFKRMDERNI